MAYKLLLLWSFVLIGRPQDLLPMLQPMRPALVLTALALFGVIFSGENKLKNVIFMKESKQYLLFFAIMIIGIPFAYHRRIAFESILLGYSLYIFFFLILVSQINSLTRLKNLILVICISAFLFSFFGLLYGSSSGGRFGIYGSMFDQNDIAYVLVSLFPFSFFYLQIDEGLIKRTFGIIVICSSIIVILKTGSRGGLLGLIIVLTIMLLTKTGGMKKSHKFMIMALIGIVFLLINEQLDLTRYLTLFDISSDYNVTDETGRTKIWEKAFSLMLSNPITGVGVNCFPMALGYMREDLGLQPIWQTTHNSFLQIGAEVGLIGFVVFILIIFRSFLTFFHASRIENTSPEVEEIRTLGGLMFLGFAGHLVTATFLSQGYSVYFVLYFALAAILKRLEIRYSRSNNTNLTVLGGDQVKKNIHLSKPILRFMPY